MIISSGTVQPPTYNHDRNLKVSFDKKANWLIFVAGPLPVRFDT